jgi:GAF domain-containing protein
VPDTHLRLLDLLTTTARELVTALGADACGISRMVGDMLILVAEAAPGGRTLQLGQGYLVPDYPETQIVLTNRCARSLTLSDPDVDVGEASVLRDLGFASLLMLPLELGGELWGLVEVYRTEPRPFGGDDQRVAAELLARLA